MMIRKSAVTDFLNEPRAHSHKVKLFTDRALSEKLAMLNPPPQFSTPPRTHQKACFLLGAQYPAYQFNLDMGLGKTYLALNLFRWRLRRGDIRRFLVIVPYTSLLQNWMDEAAIHTPDLYLAAATGNGREAREAVITDPGYDAVVITMAGWCNLICKRVAVEDSNKNKMKIDPKLCAHFQKHFDAVVFDETQIFRNHASLYYKAANQLSYAYDYRYGMTGTPFGNDPESLWAQMHVIDHGETLGETLGMYRAAFFTEKDNYWSGWPEYVFDKSKSDMLHEFMQHRAIRYAEHECLDLPPKVEQDRRVIFPEETWAYYEKIIGELIENKGQFTLTENAYIRMRQLTAGYLNVKDPEGETVEVVFKHNPKMEAMLDLLYEIPQDRKIVIFHEYTATGRLISEALTKHKYKHVWLHGGTKDKGEVQKKFKKDDSTRVMISSTAGALGNNWQVANNTIFYECPTDPIMWMQMQKRTHRQGQTLRCFEWYLVVKNSIDEKLVKSLRAGTDLRRMIIEGKASVSR